MKSVIDHLVYGYFEGGPGLKARAQVVVAVRALAEIYPNVCESLIRQALNRMGRKVADTLQGHFFDFLKNIDARGNFWKRITKIA